MVMEQEKGTGKGQREKKIEKRNKEKTRLQALNSANKGIQN